MTFEVPFPQEALKKHKIKDAFSLFVQFLGVLCTQDSKNIHYQLSIVNFFCTFVVAKYSF